MKFLNRLMMLISFVAVAQTAAAGDLMKDFDTLGGNNVLLDKAKALSPETRIDVVQDRIVARRNRWEFAPEVSTVLGGDPYNRTSNVGLNAHYHITPRWSVAVKYNYSFNQLRPEGESLINDREISTSPKIVDVDYVKQQYMALLNWYPIYGKMNLYDLGIAHFDLYAILGAGKMDLKYGQTNTYTGGGGIGFWISQHLSARAEVRYQTYNAKRYNGPIQMDTTVLAMQLGYLL